MKCTRTFGDLAKETNNDAANCWINISEERKYKMSHVFHVLYTVQVYTLQPAQRHSSQFCHFCL